MCRTGVICQSCTEDILASLGLRMMLYVSCIACLSPQITPPVFLVIKCIDTLPCNRRFGSFSWPTKGYVTDRARNETPSFGENDLVAYLATSRFHILPLACQFSSLAHWKVGNLETFSRKRASLLYVVTPIGQELH